MDLYCFNSKQTIDKTIKCSIFVASETKENQIEINFDNKIQIVNSKGLEKNDLSDKAAIKTTFSAYLLLSSEFLFDTKLFGFNLVAEHSGSIKIQVKKLTFLFNFSLSKP